MSYATIAGVSNADFWDMCRNASPTFKSHTAKATSDLFTQRGFTALTRNGLDVINEFFNLSMRVAFQKVDISKARNPLSGTGLVQVYDTPNGGYVQRIAVDSIKPVSPAYKGLEDYASVDPFVVRKPVTSERFFAQNFDYQSFISIQEFQVKQIFISDYGMGEYIAGILQGMENGYIVQEYENTLAAIDAGLNSTNYPLQNSQKLVLDSWGSGAGGTVTESDLKGLILRLKMLKESMESVSQSDAYNAAGFLTVVNPQDYVLLLRAGIPSLMDVETLAGAFHQERLFLPWEVQTVQSFGGLVPYMLDGESKVEQQPVYDKYGVEVGWLPLNGVTINGYATKRASDGKYVVNITSGGSTADTTINEGKPDGYIDTNEDIIAIVAQKGVVFENKQNPYMVSTIYNPRGMYNNYFANSPNNGIVFDHFYNFITVSKPTS